MTTLLDCHTFDKSVCLFVSLCYFFSHCWWTSFCGKAVVHDTKFRWSVVWIIRWSYSNFRYQSLNDFLFFWWFISVTQAHSNSSFIINSFVYFVFVICSLCCFRLSWNRVMYWKRNCWLRRTTQFGSFIDTNIWFGCVMMTTLFESIPRYVLVYSFI